MRLNKIILTGLLFIAACTNSEKAANVKTYFDISGFFTSEAKRLQAQHSSVEKQVSQNKASEKKRLKIENWKSELELFINSDINKASWARSYKQNITDTLIEYSALEDNLKTRYIRILKSQGKTKQISITNTASNFLYSTMEELIYCPDSIYSISKTQKVILLGTNRYHIVGKF